MSRTGALALVVMALMLAPTSLVPGTALLVGHVGASSDDGVWSDALPGVLAARNARTWVSGYPLLKMGYSMDSSGGSGEEGGASGRTLELMYTGDHCMIYVDSGCKPYPSNATIGSVSNEFDTVIWPNDTATFGSVAYHYIDIKIINIDGPYGIGGYFNPGDPGSVYIDCADINSWGFQITAHEFQHLIHNQQDPDEELWVNEGCADVAIAVCYGQADSTLTGHVDAFESYPDNDLTVFQNEIYDYGSTFAFMQYFWDRFGGQNTIRTLVSEKGNGIQGIDNTLKAVGSYETFDSLFPDWCVACRADDKTIEGGQYGYDQLKVQVQDAADWTKLPVYSGGKVVRWAADCCHFQGGDGQDLYVEFCVTSGSYQPRLFGLGYGRNSTVIEMVLAGNTATALLRGFGRDYFEAVLVTPSSTGGDYSYSAIMVDRTPPATSSLVNPSKPNGKAGWYITSPSVKLTTNEPSRTYYYWDEPPEKEYSGELSAPDGNHTLVYYSIDANDNKEAHRNLTMRVDTTLPETGIEVDPAEPDGLGGWYITVPTVRLLTEDNCSAFYSWDSGNESNYTGELTVCAGTRTLHYRSVDQAGNEGEEYGKVFRVDTTAPMAWANLTPSSPDGLGGWYRTPPVITLGSDEPDAMFLYSWDNSSDAAYVGPLVAPQGAHKLLYRARDAAGSLSPKQELGVKFDSLAPVSTLVVDPKSPDRGREWYRVRPTLQILISDADPAASAYFSWDNESFRAYPGSLKAPEGSHTLHYYSKDSRGNVENASFRVFRVDTVPPKTTVTIDPPQSEDWYRKAPRITLGAEENAQAWYSWDDEPAAVFLSPLTAPEGDHNLSYYSMDAAGNTEKARVLNFRVDAHAPVALLALSATSMMVGESLLADASGSSDENGVELYQFDFGDGYRRTSSDPREEHTYDSAGTYTINVRVRDTSGAWSEPVSTTITVSLPPRSKPPANEEAPTVSPMMFAVVIGIVVAATVAGFALAKRERKPSKRRR